MRQATMILAAITFGVLVGLSRHHVEAKPICESTDRPVKTERESGPRELLSQDLIALRELDAKQSRGEITEREHRLLWEAYVARGVPTTCREGTMSELRPSATVPRPLAFVGPGF